MVSAKTRFFRSPPWVRGLLEDARNAYCHMAKLCYSWRTWLLWLSGEAGWNDVLFSLRHIVDTTQYSTSHRSTFHRGILPAQSEYGSSPTGIFAQPRITAAFLQAPKTACRLPRSIEMYSARGLLIEKINQNLAPLAGCTRQYETYVQLNISNAAQLDVPGQ